MVSKPWNIAFETPDALLAKQVNQLLDETTLIDQNAPLSQSAIDDIPRYDNLVTHMIATANGLQGFAFGTVIGYAQINRHGDFAHAEMVVHPNARRRGLGTHLRKLIEADVKLPSFAGLGAVRNQKLVIKGYHADA
jgi:GNAT superfamily N-acetyltransferase